MFRTYNASITLDALLNKESTATTVDEKKAEYDRANKEVSSPPGALGLSQQCDAESLTRQSQESARFQHKPGCVPPVLLTLIL